MIEPTDHHIPDDSIPQARPAADGATRVTGLDFVGVQVRDIEASAAFYERHLGMRRAPIQAPEAVVLDTQPIPMALRTPLPGVDLDAMPQPGAGVALWLVTEDADALHDRLAASGVRVVRPVEDGHFGRHFAIADPDGYVLTIHGRA